MLEDQEKLIKVYTEAPHLSSEMYKNAGKNRGTMIPETGLRQLADEPDLTLKSKAKKISKQA